MRVGIATDHGGFGLKEELDIDKQELGARRKRLEISSSTGSCSQG